MAPEAQDFLRRARRMIVLLSLGLAACGGRPHSGMDVAEPAGSPAALVPPPAAGEATMVIIRAPRFGGAVQVSASVFDVTDPAREPKLIGILYRANKVTYPVKPGRHTFMVVSEAADFLQADVVAGKTYYALVEPRMGAMRPRFSFRPVRADLGSDALADWVRGSALVVNTPDSLAWAEANASSIASKRAMYWGEWSTKSAAGRAAQTLNAEDGR